MSAPQPATRDTRDVLRLAAAGVAAERGDNVFRELVRHIALALDVDHAFIGILEDEIRAPDTVKVIAGYFFRRFDDGFAYNLQDTPCANVIGQRFRCYPERVTELFADPHIKELQTEGYAGIPLFDCHGRVLGLMAIADRKPLRDLPLIEDLLKIFSVRAAVELERLDADSARGKSEDRLRATVEAALDCIIAMDRDGRVIEFNPAAERCFGFRKADILGRRLADLIIPERYRTSHEAGMSTFLETGEGAYLGRRIEVTAMRADGSEFPAELAIAVAQGGEGEIFIGYLRDIAERQQAEQQRRQLEAQLRQAQKMEAIGQLTGGIAHDFNNILTAMMGYVALAEEHTQGRNDEKLAKYLDRIGRSGQRARDLIQQMLTFSRGQRGEPRPVPLASLIKEWVNLIASTLSSSVEIVTELDPGTPAAMVDPLHIEQVLMNLCINARDAMQGQGTVTIGLHPVNCADGVCVSCRQPVAGQYIELAVSDTGPGIAPEIQERVFEPFFSTKAPGQGSGMGLAMVHGIVHEYGGHLLIDSKPGAGTTLRVLLPVVVEAPVIKGDAPAPDDSAAGRLEGRVLLVDDEPAVSEFMQDLLENWGLSVRVFNHSVEACERFAENPDAFELVVLDQTMPRMTGMEVAQHLLKLRPGLAVIIYTGYAEDLSENTVKQAGIRALVKKPVDTARLHELVESLLGSTTHHG